MGVHFEPESPVQFKPELGVHFAPELPVQFKPELGVHFASEYPYYHFLDEKENLLGFIHYSGEIRFDILNQKMEKIFIEEIKKTKFTLKE